METMQEKSILKIKDVLRLNNLLTMALPNLNNKPHYWAAYVLGKLQSVIKPYRQTIEKHSDYEKYENKIKEGLNEIQLENEFPEYINFLKEQKEIDTDIVIRSFPVEWLFKYKIYVAPLTAALYEFNLIDNIEKLLELLYTKEE